MSLIARALIFGRLDTYELTITDADSVVGDGRTVEVLQDEVTIEYGSAGSSSRSTPFVLGSSVEVRFDDPDRYLADIFTPPYDERRYIVKIEGEKTGLLWQGAVKKELRARLLAQEALSRQTTLPIYDRVAALSDLDPLTVGKGHADTLLAAQMLPLVFGLNVTGEAYTGTTYTSHVDMYDALFMQVGSNPYRNPADAESLQQASESAREVLDAAAADFVARAFLGTDGRWYFVDLEYIGGGQTVGVIEFQNDREEILEDNVVTLTRDEHRGTRDDTLRGLRRREIVRVDLEPVGQGTDSDFDAVRLVRNGLFDAYDNPTQFPYWSTTGDVQKQKLSPTTPPLGEFCLLNSLADTGTASIEQEVIEIDPQGRDLKASLTYTAEEQASGTPDLDVTIDVTLLSGVIIPTTLSHPQSLGDIRLDTGTLQDELVSISVTFEGRAVRISDVNLEILETGAFGGERLVTEFLAGDGETISDKQVDTSGAMLVDLGGSVSSGGLLPLPARRWTSRSTGEEYPRLWLWQAARRVALQPDGADIIETEVRGVYGPQVRLRIPKDDGSRGDFVIGQERRLHLVRGTTEIRDLEVTPTE